MDDPERFAENLRNKTMQKPEHGYARGDNGHPIVLHAFGMDDILYGEFYAYRAGRYYKATLQDDGERLIFLVTEVEYLVRRAVYLLYRGIHHAGDRKYNKACGGVEYKRYGINRQAGGSGDQKERQGTPK
jgi:hypothetical protein